MDLLQGARTSHRLARRVWAAACALVLGVAGLGVNSAPAGAASAAETEVQAYVTAVYDDLFHRTPDPGGLATWTRLLLTGTPRVAVANAITASDEYRGRLINDAYRRYLGRDAEAAGMASWLAFLRAGSTFQNMEAGFLAAPEYYQRAGSLNARWVARLYGDVLGRTAGSSEIAYWVGRLAGGASRYSVSMGFLNSTEHLGTVVDGFYREILGRGLDPAGRATWVGAIQHGTRLEQIIGALISSPEYVNAVGGATGSVPAAPGVSVSCRTQSVWDDLSGCGWPGPGNTGYPAGTAFSRTVSNGVVVTTDNTVIDGWDVRGGIEVRARNVVIRNSRVTMSAGGADGSGVVSIRPGASATIERTTLNGLNATHACVWHEGSSMKVDAVDCSGVNDGIFMWATQVGVDGTGDNFTITNSWLHGFTTQAANGHIDAIQTEGAKHGLIRHNTIDVAQDQNAAVALWNGRKSVDDVRVDGNLIAGGGFSVYAEDYSPSEANPAGGYSVTNVVITGNVFSTVHYGCVGYWGVWFPRGAPTDGWRRSGNVVLETGQVVDGGNPSSAGRTCN